MAIAESPIEIEAADLDVRPVSGSLGAEIHGVSLATESDPSVWQALRNAIAEHGVIFFRDQNLTPEQHIAMAEQFAPINVNRFFTAVADHPKIAEVRKEPDQKTNIGEIWHTDHSYEEAPAFGSILLAREVPSRGGDTVFLDMAMAYDHLSDGLKETLKGLRAVHSSKKAFGKDANRPAEQKSRIGNPELVFDDVVHPVVIRHPESGREVLYVNPGFTVRFEGWTEQESKPLLDFLYAHAQKQVFTCRFRWANGSIAFWDNRRTWHQAMNDYHGERRLMHRITLEGVPLSAA
jgi:alpha-ketoglutarate-dependent taurine dioxygenase